MECSFLVFHGLLLVSHSLGEYKVSGKTFTGAIEAGIISVLITVGNKKRIWWFYFKSMIYGSIFYGIRGETVCKYLFNLIFFKKILVHTSNFLDSNWKWLKFEGSWAWLGVHMLTLGWK